MTPHEIQSSFGSKIGKSRIPRNLSAIVHASIIMTKTAAFQPPVERPPLASADRVLDTSDLARLYLSSKSCPDLRAESEASDDSDIERSESSDIASFDPVGGYQPPSVVDECRSSHRPGLTSDMAARRKLQWEFEGLTLWLELEEFDNDLTRAVEDFSSKHASPFIPKPHTTAIYGMKHLTPDEARERLGMVRERIDQWPTFARPTGVQVRSFVGSLLFASLHLTAVPFPLNLLVGRGTMRSSGTGVFHRLERIDSRHRRTA